MSEPQKNGAGFIPAPLKEATSGCFREEGGRIKTVLIVSCNAYTGLSEAKEAAPLTADTGLANQYPLPLTLEQ